MVKNKFIYIGLFLSCTNCFHGKQITQMHQLVPCIQANIQEAVIGFKRPILWYVTGCRNNMLLSVGSKYNNYSIFILDQDVTIDLSSQLGKRIRLASFAIDNLLIYFENKTSNLYRIDTNWFYPWGNEKLTNNYYNYAKSKLTNPSTGEIRVDIAIDPSTVQFKWMFVNPNDTPTFCARVVSDLSDLSEVSYYCCIQKSEDNKYGLTPICYMPWNTPISL